MPQTKWIRNIFCAWANYVIYNYSNLEFTHFIASVSQTHGRNYLSTLLVSPVDTWVPFFQFISKIVRSVSYFQKTHVCELSPCHAIPSGWTLLVLPISSFPPFPLYSVEITVCLFCLQIQERRKEGRKERSGEKREKRRWREEKMKRKWREERKEN